MPSVSIIIPTNRSWEVVAPCLRSIARQSFDAHDIEVILACNGASPAAHAQPADWPFQLKICHLPAANIAAAKNAALDQAVGELLLFINDDVRLHADCIQRHREAHRRFGVPALVLGNAHWATTPEDTLFDALVYQTPMIFGFCDLEARRRYDFRSAWNLNLSIPRYVLGTRRFDERLGPFFYEDLELAFRLQQSPGACVWYEPGASCNHEHRYAPESYWRREAALAPAAVRLWNTNPDCFRAIFKTELDDNYLNYCRNYVTHECSRESELRELLDESARRPLAWLGLRSEAVPKLVRMMYHAHLPLKRLVFRRALLECVEESSLAASTAVPA